MGAARPTRAREQRGARALFRMLADDPQHGAANRAVMQGWLDEWIPVSLAAAQQLQPIWSQISEKVVRFDDSLDALEDSAWPTCWTTSTLDVPKEIRA